MKKTQSSTRHRQGKTWMWWVCMHAHTSLFHLNTQCLWVLADCPKQPEEIEHNIYLLFSPNAQVWTRHWTCNKHTWNEMKHVWKISQTPLTFSARSVVLSIHVQNELWILFWQLKPVPTQWARSCRAFKETLAHLTSQKSIVNYNKKSQKYTRL